MDRGAWWARVHGVTDSQTWLNTLRPSPRLWSPSSPSCNRLPGKTLQSTPKTLPGLPLYAEAPCPHRPPRPHLGDLPPAAQPPPTQSPRTLQRPRLPSRAPNMPVSHSAGPAHTGVLRKSSQSIPGRAALSGFWVPSALSDAFVKAVQVLLDLFMQITQLFMQTVYVPHPHPRQESLNVQKAFILRALKL